jgi:hypothetical protein
MSLSVNTMATEKAEKQRSDRVAQAQRALSTVNLDCGFHFYTAIGDYTGITAVSLQDLADKMRSVGVGSVRFHYERGDFQRWVRTIFCDRELAEEIGLIKPYFSDEALRREIIDKIEEHLSHLKAAAN